MRFADGLPVNLKYPVPPKPKPPLPLFSTMPRTQVSKKTTISQSPPSDTPITQLPCSETERERAKKKDHSTTSVFSSLRSIKSPKKATSILESMTTLRKTKLKSNSKPCDQKTNLALSNDEELKQAETLLKNISFSSDFSTTNNNEINPDSFYNVPRNNSAICLDLKEEAKGSNSIINSGLTLENKTEEEVEYFTKSDIIIERERIKALNEGYFINFVFFLELVTLYWILTVLLQPTIMDTYLLLTSECSRRHTHL